ncbi:hypothetical protein [Verrucomicrobium sp. BvORR034]|uniref:hypothetical protein n=1 Tax=Verrucomicrobium sp. BvORR034 TaxID=1396418 RepID=UPI000678B8F8|nr:hypothetical protein [Verrucomicrobium sp. BvORR034]
MKPLLPLALFWIGLFCPALKGATLLFSHQGSTNPTTEGWSSALTGSGTGQAVTSSSTNAWQVMEPGGGNALTYNQNLTSPQLTQALTTGWELSASIQYVPPNPLGATALSNNAWCTLLINEGVVVNGTQKRTLYGLYFGNDASGNTLVRLYSAGSTYTVSSGFHDYRIVYDPVLGNASFYIDGTLTASGYEGTEIDNTAVSRVYWGDNTTSSVTPGRGANYAYVGFSVDTVPEPSRAMLVILAFTLISLRRDRRPRALHPVNLSKSC